LLPLLAFFSEILPIIFYLIFLKRNRGEGLWVIFLYCLLSVVTENISLFLKDRLGTFYIFSSFTVIEYTLFAFFFYSSFKAKNFRYLSLIGTALFYLIAIFNFTSKKAESFDSLTASVEAILIIIYCILFLYEHIKDSSVIYVYSIKKFWVVIAFFIYFSSTLFLFIYAATFTIQEHKNYWAINNFFEILKDVFFCISFIMRKDTRKTYPLEDFYADI